MSTPSIVATRCLALTCFVASCSGAMDPGPTPKPPSSPPLQPRPGLAPPSTDDPDDPDDGSTASAEAAPLATHAPTSPAPEPPGPLLEQLMKSHFKQVAKIRSAVIAGRMNDAIGPARTIVEMQGVDSLPKSWLSSVRELQAASARIRQSPDLAETASATADIGMTCGGCHVVNGGPTIVVAAPPTDKSSVEARMKRHLWSAERLWEGLYGPSDAAWDAGARALAQDSLSKETLKPADVNARSLADRLRRLGKQAATARDGEDRARIYATLLGTCAPCHEQLRDKN